MTSARPTTPLRPSSAGFTLIEVITGVAISTFLVMVAGTLFQQNEQANAKNVMRFKMEDTVRFAMDSINEKLMLAGHTDCGEMRDYTTVKYFSYGMTNYDNGKQLLYKIPAGSGITPSAMTKLQGYNGDSGDVKVAANWSPNLDETLSADGFNVDDDMDAVVVRSLGKHIFQLRPSPNLFTQVGGFDCVTSDDETCEFILRIDNPLIDSTLSFDNDPVFYDISYQSSLHNGSNFTTEVFFPVAVTNCVDLFEMGITRVANSRNDGDVEGTSNFELKIGTSTSALPDFTSQMGFADLDPQYFMHAAHLDLIFVDDSGVLRITRPGAFPNTTTTGLNTVALTPPLHGGSGDVIITGFRLLYGITTAAGLPRGFVRPNTITNSGVWDSVRLVRYALAVEIVNYHPQPRARPATNLLDQTIAADTSRNLRRIYEQVVAINN